MIEINSIEGTRQIDPVTSGEGVLIKPKSWSVALTREGRLFNKNTGLRKFVKIRMWSEVCPVL